MLSVTTRKIENAVFVTIPKQLQVEAGTEYIVYKSQNGSLIFSPKMANPFLGETSYDDTKNDGFWQDLAQKQLEDEV